jgi:2,4-dienoyl-CoA reductase-like NADH-dependent reductase (Old Yellow Enzyme family)
MCPKDRTRMKDPVPVMTHPDEALLFTPYELGELQLRNRAVMSSMTRGRARNAELAPTELRVEYYRQRAAAGLIPRDLLPGRTARIYRLPRRFLRRRLAATAQRVGLQIRKKETVMEMRALGTNGPRVSAMGLGCMRMSGLGGAR